MGVLAIVIGGLLAYAVQAQSRHVSVLSRGCGEPANAQVRPGGNSKELTMQSHAGGGERRFLLHVPVGYPSTDPSSLILLFHGKGQTTFEIESETQMSSSESSNHEIVVYPEGIKVHRSHLQNDPELT